MSKRGTNLQKYALITKYVISEFKTARNQFLPVHDLDLKRWALSKARELQMNEFKASPNWILRLKKAYNIVSR